MFESKLQGGLFNFAFAIFGGFAFAHRGTRIWIVAKSLMFQLLEQQLAQRHPVPDPDFDVAALLSG